MRIDASVLLAPVLTAFVAFGEELLPAEDRLSFVGLRVTLLAAKCGYVYLSKGVRSMDIPPMIEEKVPPPVRGIWLKKRISVSRFQRGWISSTETLATIAGAGP